ncbi:MAG: sigma-54 dependent transcriptional regulator [Spirochaetales bacterium]|nr:sigma-54 dependent transcriptional regulator [Spirochaetales bacterium]
MRVLIVDDEKNIRESLRLLLQQDGFEVDCAENGFSAQRLMEETDYDAGIFDLKMPGMSGLELLEWQQNRDKSFPVMMISAFGQVHDAVDALKTGAVDYIVKPFDPEILLDKIISLKESLSLTDTMQEGMDLPAGDFFTGTSRAMRLLQKRLTRVAGTGSTVLITGESGVGKEVTARSLHERSAQSQAPFIPVNIGGIPENLLESELFGYEKGAFTGADKQKKGLFEEAAGGTLFLDEIGEMPLPLQVKMLRVLQEKKFRRLGGLEEIEISSRIVTATNRTLEDMVKDGSFREDLYYRLNIARLEIPPLRERMDDLPGLCGFLLEKLNRRMEQNIKGLSEKAWDKLKAYDFPGNIRELENILERAMIFCEEEELQDSDIELISSGMQTPSASPAADGRTLKEIEKESITRALRRWEGNRSRAADELGISRRTIINKIKEFGLDKDPQE